MSQISSLFIFLFINKFLNSVLKSILCSFYAQCGVTVFQMVSLLFWVSYFLSFLNAPPCSSQRSFGKILHINPSLYEDSCQAKFGPD